MGEKPVQTHLKGARTGTHLIDIGANEQRLEEGIGVGQVVLLDEVRVRGKPISGTPC